MLAKLVALSCQFCLRYVYKLVIYGYVLEPWVGFVMDEKALANRLQLARKRAGLTQQALCQKSGLSYSTLAKIERGAIKTPSVFTIKQIASTLGISLDDLLATVQDARPTAVASRSNTKKVSRNGVRFVYFDMNECL